MGLFEALLGAQNPLSQWAQQNDNKLTGLGSYFLSGMKDTGGIQRGAALDKELAIRKEDQTKKLAQNEVFKGWLAKTRPDLVPLLDAGVGSGDLFNQAIKPQGGDQSEYDARYRAGQQYGLTGDALNTFALSGSVPGTTRTNVTYGLTPIMGTDTTTGKTGMGVQGSDGSFKVVDTGGFQPLGPYDTNALKAAGTAYGKNTGGAQFDLPAVGLSTEQTLKAIQDVRDNEKGLDEQFSLGGIQQMTPAWPGSEKAKFQVANNRLTNRAFLEAREILRGGGQITDFESRKAEGAITNIEDAMARGDKNLYLKALKDFEDAVRDGYAKLQAQAGAMPGYGGGQQPQQSGAGWTVIGVE